LTDIVSAEKRSAIMRAVRDRDTRPELAVRRLTHRLGFRFRLHRRELPGKPDLVFQSKHKIIFVHGCFWHGHDCPKGRRTPKTNAIYWEEKIRRNSQRDAQHISQLEALGWNVLTIWECELKDVVALTEIIKRFLI
jgi:DNA mismatch endonuclease (patch repair protein)